MHSPDMSIYRGSILFCFFFENYLKQQISNHLGMILSQNCSQRWCAQLAFDQFYDILKNLSIFSPKKVLIFIDFVMKKPFLAVQKQKQTFWHISVHPPIRKSQKSVFHIFDFQELTAERFSIANLYGFPNNKHKTKTFPR